VTREAWEGQLEESRILIVDDEPQNVRLLDALLRRAGYREVTTETDPRKVHALVRSLEPDLILLDLHMPHLSGFQVMEQIVPEIPHGVYLPILVLTGDTDSHRRERALSAGARDFLTKPFESGEVLLRIKNLLETRFFNKELRGHNETLEEKVRERTHELAEAQVEIIRRLAVAAEYRDDITGQHAERVGVLSALLAEELGLPAEQVSLIRRAAPLHDVGKIGIPDSILMKPGRLTPQEFDVMKTHTIIGGRILSGSRYPLLELAETIALTHHERWDGRGYDRMRGEDIPLVGRIVAVADVFDSLTHERPYKRAFTIDESVDEILRGRGEHFDPNVVDAFSRLLVGGALVELGAKARPAEALSSAEVAEALQPAASEGTGVTT
jgi:putative two-component system response regulator